MKTHHILIVDDQRDIRRMLSTGLRSLGKDIQVMDVPSGEEAMLILSRQQIDLLVTDVRLPGITGLELTERACLRSPDLKLIVITGVTDPQTRREVENAGVEAFFIKPIEMADFLKAADRCLGKVNPDISHSPDVFLPKDEPETVQKAQPDLPAVSKVETDNRRSDPISISTPQDALIPLSRLRWELSAAAVLMVDERGRVIERLGALQDPVLERTFISTFQAAFTAGVRLSGVDGDPCPEALLYFGGQQTDYFASRAGRFTILAALRHANSIPKLDVIHAAVRQASEELRLIPMPVALPDLEPEPAPSPVPAEEVDEAELAEMAPVLDEIFGMGQGSFADQDVDAFWDALVENGTDNPLDERSLSFEQAQQLGLKLEEGEA